LALPALTLGIVGAAGTARYQRAATLDVIGQDYVRTARAKGLPGRRVVLVHALRNALLPFISLVGLAFPFLLTGAVLVEWIFAWLALAAPVVAPYDPDWMPGVVELQNRPPSGLHPLGTDPYSRDVWSRLVYGARISLGIGALATLVAVTLGAAVGAFAGYCRRWVDAVLMRLVDVGLALPRIFVLLMVVALWEHVPLAVLVLVIGLTSWFGTSRLVRGEVLSLRERA